MSHLGRPEKANPDERKNLTMDRVAARFGELLGVRSPDDRADRLKRRLALSAKKPAA